MFLQQTSEKALLPTGKYDARLDIKSNLLNVENFRYQAAPRSLSGQAKVKLLTEKATVSLAGSA